MYLSFRSVRPRFVVCLLALLAGASILSSPLRAQVKLDLTPGFDNNYRANSWTPLTVKIANPSVNGAAQLQVVVRSQYGGTRNYSLPIRLQPGTNSEQHTLYYFHPDVGESPEIIVQLIADGRMVAEKKLDNALQIQDDQPAILALTQDQSGLNYLTNVDLGYRHRNMNDPSQNGQWNGNPSFAPPGGSPGRKNPNRILYPRGSALPNSASGYTAMDAIVLGDLPLDTFSEDQWSALIGWVKDGGILVISGGADINRARNKMLADLLPIVPTGVAQVKSLNMLGEIYGSVPKFSTTPIIEGKLKTDSVPLCEDGGRAIVSSRRIGNGTVVFTAFDTMAPEFRAWPGQQKFWQDVMQRAERTIRVTEAVRTFNQPVVRNRWMGYEDRGNRALSDALAGIQSTQAPRFQYIGLFLLLYIICLVPVNYLILKKWDKRELAWLTSLAIIFVFSTGAYAVGYRIKGGQLYLRYCSVIEGASNTDGYAAYTVASIFSPRQARYDLTIKDPNGLATEVTEGTNGMQRQAGDLSVESDQQTTIRNTVVNMWDHRNFDFETHLNLPGHLTATLEPTAPLQCKVHLYNGTGFDLTECALSFRGNQTIVGDLKAGQSRDIKFTYAGNGGTSGISVLSAGTQGAPSTENQIKAALASMASNASVYDANSAQNVSPFVFTGWLKGDVVGLSLANEQPEVTGVNLLVIHLPTPGGIAPSRPVRIGEPMPGSGGGFNSRAQVNGGSVFVQSLPPSTQGLSADGLNNLAYTYANQGNLDAALLTAKRAQQMAPNDGNIMDSLAEMYQRRKDFKKAAPLYVKAIALQGGGGITETNAKYGETLISLGKKKEAIPYLQRAARNNQDRYGIRAQQLLQQLGAKSPYTTL